MNKGGTPKNLISLNERTEEEARAIRSAGGKASVEKRKQLRNLKESMELILEHDVTDADTKQVLKELGIPETEANNNIVIALAVFNKAKAGDLQAVQLLRDIIRW